MKRNHLVAIFLILSGMFASAQQNFIYISGHVTDIDLNIPVSDHPVYAACNDSLGFYTFQTDEEGYYGDTLFINTVNVTSILVYTFDCMYMMHDTLVTDLSGPVIADFAICTQNIPPDCWASFFYYPDSLDYFTWHFVDMSYVPDGTLPDSWFWEFGDGTASGEQNPTHTFAGEGIYWVCLTITDSETGCENTYCMELMILGGPSGCENYFSYTTNDGYTFAFTGSANSTNPVSYFWDFGDGTTGEGQDVTHTYPPDPPIWTYYNVCLTTFTIDSIGDSCMDVSCQQVWVGGPMDCQAWFYYYPATDSLLNQLAFQFIDNSMGQHDSWLWDFGDGESSTSPNPLHIFADTGVYTVCLNIWDSAGICESMYCEDVYAGVLPPFDCFNFFNYFVEDSLTVTFIGEAYGGGMLLEAETYTWDFGDGTTGEGQTVTHSYAPEGPDFYTVCLETMQIDPATGDTCEAVSCMDVWIREIPPIGCENYFTVEQADSTTYTFYGEAYYEGMPVPANSYLWDFGDGTTGEGQTVTHTYSEVDSVIYMVCLTTIYFTDPILNDSCYAVSCQMIGDGGGSEDQFTLTGQVFMGNTFADFGQVSLYLANPSGEMVPIAVQPIDSTGQFYFAQVYEGNYYLLAELLEGSSDYGNFLPTYYIDAVTWTDADMITLGEPANPYNIYLVPSSDYSPGAGEINGTVNTSYGLFRDGLPISGIEIILMDHDEESIEYVYSSDLGSFDFPSLEWGTYKVHAEVPGKVTDPAWVTLDEEHPLVTVEFMITQTEVYNTLSVEEPDPFILSAGEVYPNPVTDVASVAVTLSEKALLSVRIFNQLGQEVWSSYDTYEAGNHLIQFNISHLDKGVYILNIGNDKIGGIIKKIIK